MIDMELVVLFAPKSPVVSGLLAAAVYAGTWLACLRLQFADDDVEDEK